MRASHTVLGYHLGNELDYHLSFNLAKWSLDTKDQNYCVLK